MGTSTIYRSFSCPIHLPPAPCDPSASLASSPRASAAFASSRAKVPCCSTPGCRVAETENPETWWSPKRMEAVEAMISRGSPKFLEGFWNRSPSWKSQLGPEGLNSSQNWASDTLLILVSLGPVISRLGPRAVFDGIFGGLRRRRQIWPCPLQHGDFSPTPKKGGGFSCGIPNISIYQIEMEASHVFSLPDLTCLSYIYNTWLVVWNVWTPLKNMAVCQNLVPL